MLIPMLERTLYIRLSVDDSNVNLFRTLICLEHSWNHRNNERQQNIIRYLVDCLLNYRLCTEFLKIIYLNLEWNHTHVTHSIANELLGATYLPMFICSLLDATSQFRCFY